MQREIADIVGVSPAAISQWLKSARLHGEPALASHMDHGRLPKLTAQQLRTIPEFLWHGAEAYGFRGELWTCQRIASVIREEFNVQYHAGHVSRILRWLGWSPQMPVTRAAQRDESAIKRWRLTTWPQLQTEARKQRRTLVFVDESGFYLLPGVVRTYAPIGVTPILRAHQTRDHLSVFGALTDCGKVYTLVRQHAFDGTNTIEFLQHLLRVTGTRLLVIWDGSPIHRRVMVQEFAAGLKHAIRLEQLPAYAPDLNPVEGVWQHLKHVELANVICHDLEEVHCEFHLAIGRIRHRPQLLQTFFHGADLY